MNYVDWCLEVLSALWTEQNNDGDPSFESISETIWSVPYSYLEGSFETVAIQQATTFLLSEGLIDSATPFGLPRHFRVGAVGRDALEDPTILWREAANHALTDDEHVMLDHINELSHRQDGSFAWTERKAYDDLRGRWNESDSVGQRSWFLEALRSLRRMEMVRFSTSNTFEATFTGIAKQFKGESAMYRTGIDFAFQESAKATSGNKPMVLHPIFVGRTLAVDESLCFVLMPFNSKQNKVFELAIEPAIREAGLNPIRADNIHDIGIITEQVWEHICRARVIVADLAAHNPNVYYELGLADVVGKSVILLQPDDEKAAFDVTHRRQIRYSYEMGSEADLKSKLVSSLSAVLRPT